MFNRKKTENALLDEAIKDCYSTLKTQMPDSKEHAATARQIVELEKLKASLKDKSWTPSPDTIALIGANILGIVLVLHFEKTGAIVSKGFGMISKAR